MNKYSTPSNGELEQEIEETLETHTSTKLGSNGNGKRTISSIKKQKKTRKPRAFRIFNYRQITFFLIAKGDLTLICTLDPKTNQPVPAIEVPRASAIKAAQALAKLQITEKYLDTLGAKITKNKHLDIK